jgi:hypothetical protein
MIKKITKKDKKVHDDILKMLQGFYVPSEIEMDIAGKAAAKFIKKLK